VRGTEQELHRGGRVHREGKNGQCQTPRQIPVELETLYKTVVSSVWNYLIGLPCRGLGATWERRERQWEHVASGLFPGDRLTCFAQPPPQTTNAQQ
jgi:hypothetical protein